jgi:serine/threonine protein phosphatase 1
MTEPLAIVGDIHGDVLRLRALLERILPFNRRVVFVGDYINRGPSSAEVLELLASVKAKRDSQVVLLAGNHEMALLRYLEDKDLPAFAAYGGLATIRSYVGLAHGDVHAQFTAALPIAHQRLLRNHLEVFCQTEDVLISHAGIDPSRPDERSREVLVETSHPALFDEGLAWQRPRPLVVFGHYVQRTQLPYVRDGIICLDTGCGTLAGPLTALLLPENQFLSA